MGALIGFGSRQGLDSAQPTPSAQAPGFRQAASSTSGLSQATKDRITNAYGRLPLSFVPNKGQTDRSVRYYTQGAGFGFYFTDNKAVLSFQGKERGQALDLRFIGASANAALEPGREGQHRSQRRAKHHCPVLVRGFRRRLEPDRACRR